MRVWVPYSTFVTDIESLDSGVEVDVFTGSGAPPESIATVQFYVVPYSFTPTTLEIAAQMGSLQVIQTLTAGYEHVLPYLPSNVTLCNARGVHDSSTAELAADPDAGIAAWHS